MDTKTPTEHQIDPARRKLLRAAPLGAIAVAAAVTGRGAEAAPAPAPAAQPEPDAKPSGYHETEHIRRYYSTAAYW